MKEKIVIVEMLIEKAEQYAKTSIDLYKLKAIDKVTDIFAAVVSGMFVAVFIIFFLILASVGLALYLGEVFGKGYYGFFAVAGIYLLVGIIFMVAKKSMIEEPLNDYIVKQAFKTKKR